MSASFTATRMPAHHVAVAPALDRLAGVSIDVDSVRAHLQGYGFATPASCPTALHYAVPRILETLAALDLRGTFFLVAADACDQPDAVRSISAAGHEIACHSMTHPLPFAQLPPEHLRREVRDAKMVLEDLVGKAVDGFRAPGWDLSERVLMEVVEAGYTYDASAYPPAWTALARLAVYVRGARKPAKVPFWNYYRPSMWGPPAPHLRWFGEKPLAEIPLWTTPLLGMPYYHTLQHLVPSPIWRCTTVLALRRRRPVVYGIHAVDFMDSVIDDLDGRILGHPGMRVPLPQKLHAIKRVLGRIAGERRIVTLREIACMTLQGAWASNLRTDEIKPCRPI